MPTRRGSQLVEAIVALAIVGVAAGVALQTAATLRRQARRLDAQETALLAADNLLETLSAWPWEDLTPEALAEVTLHADVAAQLDRPRLRIFLEAQSEPPASKRIEVVLEQGDPTAPLPVTRLVTWRYRDASAR